MAISTLAAINDQPVTCLNGALTIAGTADLAWGSISHWWPMPEHHYHYTTIPTYPPRPNPYEAAFKIVAKLIERGVVADLTVARFMELVNDVAAIVKEA